jgi:hypothetical protein
MELGIQAVIRSYEVEKTIDWDILFELYDHSREAKENQLASLTRLEQEVVKRGPKLEADDPNTEEWRELLRKLNDLQHLPPESDEIQQIIEQINKKSEELYQGDEVLMKKAWEMRKNPHHSYRYYPIKENIIQLLDKAFEIYDQNQRQSSGTKKRSLL